MIKTDGVWDSTEERILFSAGSLIDSVVNQANRSPVELDQSMTMIASENRKSFHKLVSLRDYDRKSSGVNRKKMDFDLESYDSLFLDSGVFGVAMDHAKAHGLSHNEALNTPLKKIDDWNRFYAMYVETCLEYKDRLWGYVELDLGGTTQKQATREGLEKLGLHPIPVWHPLTDGLEYGEYLMSTYDRICLGNLVKSDIRTRLTVLRAMARIKQNHRHVWVHALGLGMCELALCFPINSCDAITWMGPLMWPTRHSYSLATQFRDDGRFYSGEENSQYFMAYFLLEAQVRSNEQNWRAYDAAKLAAAH